MEAHIAYASGSPSRTLVLPMEPQPEDGERILAIARECVRRLSRLGGELQDITKIAIVSPSTHPLFDLDYRFVQVLPGPEPGFDLNGSCGHSVLASALIASRLGWIHPLAPDQRVRVNVLNTGDHLVCEVDESVRDRVSFTTHFLRHPSVALRSLLLDDQPTDRYLYEGGAIRASAVSTGNPYVFIDAHDLGVGRVEELFDDDPGLFRTLSAIRRSAAAVHGFPLDGAFPKIAALLPDGDGRVAVRALSVPSWHPTIALTGAVCLGAAVKIAGTIPHTLAGPATAPGEPLQIHTSGGTATVRAAVTGNAEDDRLAWVSVPRKDVEFIGSIDIDRIRPTIRTEDLLHANR